MTQLTFNSTRLLFVRVPMDANNLKIWHMNADSSFVRFFTINGKIRLSDKIPSKSVLLGHIQKSGGQVTTSIEDEVLEGLVASIPRVDKKYKTLRTFVAKIRRFSLPLDDDYKYAVLEINP
jgi:hypothetical protein